jgi:uncharacterized membrane-anchored protein YhcB (DUF1043 family)
VSPEAQATTELPEGQIAPAPEQTEKPKRRWIRWGLPAGALVIGLAVGAVAGAGDPTESEEYRAQGQSLVSVQDELESTQERVETLENQVAAAKGQAERAETIAASAATARNAELDTREAALVAREQAVTATEQAVKASSIRDGIWTVGVDIEPGSYRVSEALTGYCYWAITQSGTNGDDIIENDGPTGGFPTVRLSAGQDFENNGCGTFVKQ